MGDEIKITETNNKESIKEAVKEVPVVIDLSDIEFPPVVTLKDIYNLLLRRDKEG